MTYAVKTEVVQLLLLGSSKLALGMLIATEPIWGSVPPNIYIDTLKSTAYTCKQFIGRFACGKLKTVNITHH